MIKYVIKIDGMMCPRCEAHVNEAIKENFDVKSVKASRSNKEAVVLAEKELDEEKLVSVVKETGYTFLGLSKQ